MGVRIPVAVWRRCRLWKISRYSEDSVGEFYTGSPALAVQQLDLHSSLERLHYGVVETVPDGSYGRNQTGFVSPLGERPGGAFGGPGPNV